MLSSRYTPLTVKKKSVDSSTASQFGESPAQSVVAVSTGFIQPVNGSEPFAHLKLDQKATHRLYCPPTLFIKHGQIVEQAGQVYNVIYADQPDGISSVGHHREILLERYGNGR